VRPPAAAALALPSCCYLYLLGRARQRRRAESHEADILTYICIYSLGYEQFRKCKFHQNIRLHQIPV
jgi:hypothetical protein